MGALRVVMTSIADYDFVDDVFDQFAVLSDNTDECDAASDEFLHERW